MKSFMKSVQGVCGGSWTCCRSSECYTSLINFDLIMCEVYHHITMVTCGYTQVTLLKRLMELLQHKPPSHKLREHVI